MANVAQTIIRKLKMAYPDAHCALHHSSPLELLVATILSAQCTDDRVNQVTPHLFRRYRSANDYAEAPRAELEHDLRSINFFRNKAKALQGAGQKLVAQFGGEVPRTMEELVQLPGVGRKTANVVLGNAFQIPVGIVVDTHVGRLAHRMGLSRGRTPESIEQDLMKVIPKKDWIIISHLLIFHGRQVCKARKPDCGRCVLKSVCPRRGVDSKH